ncbi:hypothetical protein HZS_7252, partial [Henneguya salminicola]
MSRATFERRILVVSSDISKLSSLMQSLVSCLSPLSWCAYIIIFKGTYIYHCFAGISNGISKDSMLYPDYAPMPFIIGMIHVYLRSIGKFLNNVVCYNMDDNSLKYPLEFYETDLKNFTEKNVKQLSKKLSENILPKKISKVFLKFNAELFGHYELCIYSELQCISFDKEKFINILIQEYPEFKGMASILISSQSFQHFLYERMNSLKRRRYYLFDQMCENRIKNIISNPKNDDLINSKRRYSVGYIGQAGKLLKEEASMLKLESKDNSTKSGFSKFISTNVHHLIPNFGNKKNKQAQSMLNVNSNQSCSSELNICQATVLSDSLFSYDEPLKAESSLNISENPICAQKSSQGLSTLKRDKENNIDSIEKKTCLQSQNTEQAYKNKDKHDSKTENLHDPKKFIVNPTFTLQNSYKTTQKQPVIIFTYFEKVNLDVLEQSSRFYITNDNPQPIS